MRKAPPEIDLRRIWGANLRSLRMQRGLTQDAMSVALGIALKNYQRFESGRHNPTLDTIGRIAAVLCLPVAAQFPASNGTIGVLAPVGHQLPNGWRWVDSAELGVEVYRKEVSDQAHAESARLELLGHARTATLRRRHMSDLLLLGVGADWYFLRRPVTQPWVGKTVLVQQHAEQRPLARPNDCYLARLTAIEASSDGALQVRLEAVAAAGAPDFRTGTTAADLGLCAELIAKL